MQLENGHPSLGGGTNVQMGMNTRSIKHKGQGADDTVKTPQNQALLSAVKLARTPRADDTLIDQSARISTNEPLKIETVYGFWSFKDMLSWAAWRLNADEWMMTSST
eukprot:467661-Amphidinium_carterae.1